MIPFQCLPILVIRIKHPISYMVHSGKYRHLTYIDICLLPIPKKADHLSCAPQLKDIKSLYVSQGSAALQLNTHNCPDHLESSVEDYAAKIPKFQNGLEAREPSESDKSHTGKCLHNAQLGNENRLSSSKCDKAESRELSKRRESSIDHTKLDSNCSKSLSRVLSINI